MSLKSKLIQSFKNYLKFQLIPLPFTGLIISILGLLVNFNLISMSFDIFKITYDPLFLTFHGIGTFLYIDRFYREKLSCLCHTGKRKKIHQLSGLVTGIFSSFVFYLIPVSFLFFIIFDSHSKDYVLGKTIEVFSVPIPFFVLFGIFGFLTRLISKEVFESMDGNSGILFNMKKSIPTQMRELVYELKKPSNNISI